MSTAQAVVYCDPVDLLDTELFTDSFAELKRTGGRRNQTVTFPFRIVMKDILHQSVGMRCGQPILQGKYKRITAA